MVVKKKKKKIKRVKPINPFLTGEDIDMLRDNNQRKQHRESVCDTHEDGA